MKPEYAKWNNHDGTLSNHVLMKPGQVHFFYTIVNETIQNPRLTSYYHTVLSKPDRRKINRFIFKKDKTTCLATRALVRFVLSRYSNIPPKDLQFIKNKYGKPKLKSKHGKPPLQFNISHSGRITACAVTLNQEIGIDVEDVSRKVNLNIADRFFSEKESSYLKSLPDHLKTQSFLEIWTLKEAYIKAKGMGLSIPLNKFSFEIQGEKTSIHFEKPLNDKPGNWTFFKFPIKNLCQAAVAVHASDSLNTGINLYKCIPFTTIENQTLESFPAPEIKNQPMLMS